MALWSGKMYRYSIVDNFLEHQGGCVKSCPPNSIAKPKTDADGKKVSDILKVCEECKGPCPKRELTVPPVVLLALTDCGIAIIFQVKLPKPLRSGFKHVDIFFLNVCLALHQSLTVLLALTLT